MKVFHYLRCSTKEQNESRQVEAMKDWDIKNNVNMWLVFFRDFVIYSYFCISLKIRFRGTKTHTDPKTNTFANADTATAFAGAPS